jgi:hypothetical protein
MAPSVSGSHQSRFPTPSVDGSEQSVFPAPSAAGFSYATSKARYWQADRRSDYRGPMTSYAAPSGGVFNAPAFRDPEMSQRTKSRLDQDRSKKRRHEETQKFVSEKAAPLPKKYAQIIPNKFDMTDVHPGLRQIPENEFICDLRNRVGNPSYYFGLHDDSPQLNMYSQVDGRVGRYVAKVLGSDAASLDALAQTMGALCSKRNGSVVVVTFDIRSAEMDENIPAYQEHVSALANVDVSGSQGFRCCNCGKSGHTVKECAVPHAPNGKLAIGDWGTIPACPQCNSKLHIIDDCRDLKAQMDSSSSQENLMRLGDMVCWGRYNRPALKSETWFFLDLLEQCNGSGVIQDSQLAEPIANYVPWTEKFARDMATVTGPKLGPNHPMYIEEYSGDVAQSLPKDPFWNNKTVAQALEMHKAGAFDHFRYISKATRAQRFPPDGEPAVRMMTTLMMFLEHAGLWGPPRTPGIDGDCELLVDDEIPKQNMTVVHVADSPCDDLRFPAAQLLNPGVWRPHPTGIVIPNEDGSQTVTDFVVFVPTDECEELQKADPVLFQRVKRAVNRYRLKRTTADSFDRDDFVETFIATMAATARSLRLQQNEADAEAEVDDGLPSSAELAKKPKAVSDDAEMDDAPAGQPAPEGDKALDAALDEVLEQTNNQDEIHWD